MCSFVFQGKVPAGFTDSQMVFVLQNGDCTEGVHRPAPATSSRCMVCTGS